MDDPDGVAFARDPDPDQLAAAETGADAGSRPSRSLLRDRDFRIFLGGQGISALGDAVSFTALPLLVLLLTGSGVAMGIVGILETLPDLIVGLPAGALADRWDRRRMMLWADFGRAALISLIPLSVLLGFDTMTVILLVTAPIHVLRVLFMAAFTGALPTLAGPDRVGQANGISEAVFSFSFIVGPVIAGVLSGVIGPAMTLAVDAVSFALSAVTLLFIRRDLRPAKRTGETHLLAEIREGIAFIWRERTLRVVVAYWGTVSVVTGPIVPAVIFFLTRDRAQGEEIVGAILSAFGLGYLLGAIAAGRFAKGRLGLFMLAGSVGQALALIVFAIGDSLPLWIAGSFLVGSFGALVLVSYITLRATIPPNELLGRVGSTARTISIGLAPGGLFVGGVLLDTIGGRATIVTVAAAMLAATVLFALSGHLRGAVMRVHDAATS